MNIDYKQKYIKYKQKYISLKELLGGSGYMDFPPIINKQAELSVYILESSAAIPQTSEEFLDTTLEEGVDITEITQENYALKDTWYALYSQNLQFSSEYNLKNEDREKQLEQKNFMFFKDKGWVDELINHILESYELTEKTKWLRQYKEPLYVFDDSTDESSSDEVLSMDDKSVESSKPQSKPIDEQLSYPFLYYENNKQKMNSEQLIYGQKLELSDESKICLIGDIHGSFNAFIDIIKDLELKGFFKESDKFELNDNHHIIFLGDIVDYSPLGLECFVLALILKKDNMKNVHIINGNHESYGYAGDYGRGQIKTELSKQGIDRGQFLKLLHHLPSVIFLRYVSKWYQLCHGAFDDKKTELISEFLQPENVEIFIGLNSRGRSNFKWGDFGNEVNSVNVSDRGMIYGKKDTDAYLRTIGINCIISGHQDQVPLGLVIYKDIESKQPHKIDNYNFYRTSDFGEGEYSLFTPEVVLVPESKVMYGTSTIAVEGWNERRKEEIEKRKENGEQIEDEFVIKLKPGKDFMAMVTSTASQSKNTMTCYSILS